MTQVMKDAKEMLKELVTETIVSDEKVQEMLEMVMTRFASPRLIGKC